MNGKIYVAGGTGSTDIGSRLQIYDISRNEWNNISMPQSLVDASLIAIGNKLYIIGGRWSNALTGTVHILDTADDAKSWSVGSSMEIPSCGGSLWNFDGYIYYFGGADGTGAAYKQASQRYHIASDQWERIDQMPGQPLMSAIIPFADRVYLAGGGYPMTATTCIYTFSSGRWTPVSELPVALRALSGAVWENTLYVFGGRDSSKVVDTIYSMELDPPKLYVYLDQEETAQLSLYHDLGQNREFEWTSSNMDVTVVDNDSGLVTAVGAGVSEVYAEKDGFRDYIPFKVKEAEPIPEEPVLALHLEREETKHLWFGDDPYTVTWSVESTDICSVSESGAVTGQGQGITVAQAEENGYNGEINVRVNAEADVI